MMDARADGSASPARLFKPEKRADGRDTPLDDGAPPGVTLAGSLFVEPHFAERDAAASGASPVTTLGIAGMSAG